MGPRIYSPEQFESRIAEIKESYQVSGSSNFKHVTGNLMQVIWFASEKMKEAPSEDAQKRYQTAAANLDKYLSIIEQNPKLAIEETSAKENYLGGKIIPIAEHVIALDALVAQKTRLAEA